MKAKSKIFLATLAVLFVSSNIQAADIAPKVALVNFKTCVETSKMGKVEQANFEKIKKQMEDVVSEKEKALKEISAKFNDEDYLDSLSSDAQAELKHKYRNLNQELAQYQQQFYQMLQQTNYKVIQKMTDEINEAAKAVAKKKNLDVIINEEGTFFYNPSLDISNDIVKEMDERFKNTSPN